MHVLFEYSRDRDVWAILNFGRGTRNHSQPTATWKTIVERYGTSPTEQQISDFIEQYIIEHPIDINQFGQNCQHAWDSIAERFITRAESVFKVSLPHDISAYPTIGERGPYNIENNFFMVSIHNPAPVSSTMHELWHFYTWYALDEGEERRLGRQAYNDIKESLTVLLNIECADLMPPGFMDKGYPQHQQLRARIMDTWKQERDITRVWNDAVQSYKIS